MTTPRITIPAPKKAAGAKGPPSPYDPGTHQPTDAPIPPEGSVPEVRFVMCAPTYLSNDIPNNVFMDEDKGPVDVDRALRQWDRAKHLFEALGIEILEIEPVEGAQDQTFVSNVAVAIEPYIVLANYKAAGRPPEVEPARKFFEGMGYQCIQPPYDFEGDAELKRLSGNVYIGGHGKFTDIRSLDWIEQQTGCEIIRVKETSDKLYHLDCSLIVIDEENVLASPDGLDKASMKELDKYVNVVEIPKGMAGAGVTNGVKIAKKRVYCSGTLQPEDPTYRKAIEWLLETMDEFGYVVTFLDTDAVNVSGADLSCQVMTLDFYPSTPAKGPKSPQLNVPASKGTTRG